VCLRFTPSDDSGTVRGQGDCFMKGILKGTEFATR
jgi:hypothetical protein